MHETAGRSRARCWLLLRSRSKSAIRLLAALSALRRLAIAAYAGVPATASARGSGSRRCARQTVDVEGKRDSAALQIMLLSSHAQYSSPVVAAGETGADARKVVAIGRAGICRTRFLRCVAG